MRFCILRWHESGDPELGLDHATGSQPIPQVARLEMDKELSMGQFSHPPNYDRGQGMRPCQDNDRKSPSITQPSSCSAWLPFKG